MDDGLLLLSVLLLAREVKKSRRRKTESSDNDASSNDANSEDNSMTAGNDGQQTSSPKSSRANTIANLSTRTKVAIARIAGRAEMKRRSTTIGSSNKGSLKKIKTTTLSSDSESECLTDGSDNDVNEQLLENHGSEHCKVDISHQKYPEVRLNDEEIMKIKNSLLAEIDETEDLPADIGFISTISEDGWLSLTCQNTQTKDWLMGAISKLNSTLNMDIKACIGGALLHTFICTLHISPEDIMAPDALKHRLAKQNVGLSTNEWRFLKAVKNERGGQTVTYCIDAKSKSIIETRGSKLFLNFSQTIVEVK